MVRYYKLSKVHEKVKFTTVRNAWNNNEIRKGFLKCLNKLINLTTPTISPLSTHLSLPKSVIISCQNHGLSLLRLINKLKNIYTNKLTLGFLLIKLKLAMLIMNSKKICKVMVIL